MSTPEASAEDQARNKVNWVACEHEAATGECIGYNDIIGLLTAYTPRHVLQAALAVEDAIAKGHCERPWGLLKHVLRNPGGRAKGRGKGGDGPAAPLVPIDRRWQEILEDCDGHVALAARTLIAMLCAPLAVRPPDTYEDTEAAFLYHCDQVERDEAGTRSWRVSEGDLLDGLRTHGLAQWADWYEHVIQTQGSKGD